MSKLLFEEFLARLFCQYIEASNSIDTKYHFVSSNPAQSLQLYNGFKVLNFKPITIGDLSLKYIETDNGKKIIVMLHHLGDQDKNSSHEDYIAGVRDAINDIDNAVLFVINNSSLETLTSTFTDVSLNESVFTPQYVNQALVKLGSGHKDELIFKYLVANVEQKIRDENLSIFGYQPLYYSIDKDKIDLREHGLFLEPRLSDIHNEKELKKELDKNHSLSRVIRSRVNDFNDDPAELQRQLEDVGLSERYIAENFLRQNRDKYKNETFSNIEAEIEKNKDRKLDVTEIELNGSKLEEWKRLSGSLSARKNISLIGEVELRDIDLKIKMLRGEPLLKAEEVIIHGDLKQNQIKINTSNHELHSTLNVRIPFDGQPIFIQIKLYRPSQRECFQFNCCFVEKERFYIKNYFEKLEVEIKRNKGKLILENVQGKMLINPNGSIDHAFSCADTEINCDDLQCIDFRDTDENEVIGDFELLSGEYHLPMVITGSKVVENVKLPSLFDSQRGLDIFSQDRIPKYKPITSRVIISGREKELSVKAKELCSFEYKMLDGGVLYFDENASNTLYVADIKDDFPRIAKAYKALFSWLSEHETLISITNWPASLLSLVEDILASIQDALIDIPQGALAHKSRKLLEIGIIRKVNEEFFTPFHPLCLSYAFEFAKLRITDEGNSFSQIPATTIDKFNAGGLLPVLFDEHSSFVRTQALSHNKLWLEIAPQLESGDSYVSSLVYEKVQDFLTCFEMLFQQSEDAPLIINSINNQKNTQVFKGILNYYKKAKGKLKKIRVNVYDDKYFTTAFEEFSEFRKIEELRELVRLSDSDKEAVLDDLIFKVRKNLTVHKVREFDNYDYAHISFFKNIEEVTLRSNNVSAGKSGIVCNGILSGEASYLENEVFYTGFGLKNVKVDNFTIRLASLYNQLLLAYRDKAGKYIHGNVPVLAVQDTFRHHLSKSYDTSIWTCIIDPKVTLEFFDTKETILIHYADQYTNSVAYDAITVSSRVGLYKDLLQSQSDELINSFNALNGQWLLNIVKESGKKKTDNTEKQIKEKQGIVAAYKFLSSLLLSSDLTWVPLSVGEMLRVTGNLGLEIRDHDFSARLHNKSKGALSDDILFVGIRDEELVLLPLEVKSRKTGTDFAKAIQQAKALSEHMKRLLGPKTFKGKVYRSLFIQQILTQVDKFELYNVFPESYFSNLHELSDSLLMGNYNICDISNYPQGIALAFNEGMERQRIESELDEELNVLKVRLPQAFVKMLHEESIQALFSKFKDRSAYPEISKLSLLNSELKSFVVEEKKSEYEDECSTTSSTIESCESIEPNFEQNKRGPEAEFEYPVHLTDIVGKLLNLYQRDISVSDVLFLSENDLEQIENFESSDLLSFYRLKDLLSNHNVENTIPHAPTNDDSSKLNSVNVTSEYRALVNTLLREFGENLSINQTLEIDIPTLENINGFGRGKVRKFLDFIEKLKKNYFSVNSTDEIVAIEDFDLPLDELENYLISDLQNYFLQDKTRENDILSRRLGVNCSSETLEEIGQSYDITRERIRQIEYKAKKNFIAKLSISPRVIWAITKSSLSELRSPLFPSLRSYFGSNRSFYSFLEVCCGLNENEIKKVTTPNLNKTELEEFWAWNKSPASIEDLSWHLHENMNVELAVAENQISTWIQDGVLQLIENDQIKPLALAKVPGITNAILDFPNGDVWANIQTHANAKSIASSQYSEKRLEPNLMRAVDKEYVYQSGRGTYRHIKYLNINEDDKMRILSVVLSKLNECKHAGRESVNLSVDIYQRANLSDDYFLVRHIVRAYGEPEGIFFNGKSGADTVSLASNFSLASQKTVLIELFEHSLSPLSKIEIASKIRSQSLGHAAFYLDKLLTDGVIVRVDETHYSHINNAFTEIDIEETLQLAFSFVDSESRIIEGEKIQSYLNRHLDKENNKYFYLSLLKTHALNYKKSYFFAHNLVSQREIGYSGLAEICRELLGIASTRAEAIELAKNKLCIHEHILKRCFDQVSITNRTDGFSAFSLSDIKKSDLHNKNDSEPLGNIEMVEQELTSYSANNINIEDCRILIGRAIDNLKPVYWEYGNKDLANRHLIVFGRSGQGKTYCIQGLLMEMAKANCNSLVIDYTNGFLPNHLESEFNGFVNPKSHFLAQKPLGISPFRKQKQDFGGVILEEQDHIVAARIASVFNQVYSSIGEQQLATLINVLEDGVHRHGKQYDFDCMLDDLREAGRTGEALANKLSPMVKSKLFNNDTSQNWQTIFNDGTSRTNIVQLASLSRDIMQLATEFTLWDLYSYACSYGNKSKPIPIVLDEVQNLDHRLESPLGKMLTEGRKYGISLILATQTLSMLSKDEQDRLFQASHKLFFAPAETEIQTYAKLLEQAVPGTSRKVWLDELAKLKKGECISVGLHMNEGGFVEQGAKVVKVASLDSRE
ncbi:DNA phosphorothioation-dependent restriction protein DptH [Shewanella sp. NKUCC01_JLK]|uniref:DNA phosphorothioation-dependent restriction protein DptH n=1 Tax=Shewanella sp. NKUCC01_JLK TaxID=2842123 RepID=UPI001C5B0A30|nr:DNA phosphorothioation-dependent restriction protein DptH [Shewanella sp. NKUCC01_JLK]MBW3513354.1 DNA phosphorothioation-dependent restriction protein DptH [Shewanella sp. NKUCC01_JLK]